MSNINSVRKIRKPASEWVTPGTFDPATDYQSDVEPNATHRAHAITEAVAASTGQAGLDEGDAAKKIVSNGV